MRCPHCWFIDYVGSIYKMFWGLRYLACFFFSSSLIFVWPLTLLLPPNFLREQSWLCFNSASQRPVMIWSLLLQLRWSCWCSYRSQRNHMAVLRLLPAWFAPWPLSNSRNSLSSPHFFSSVSCFSPPAISGRVSLAPLQVLSRPLPTRNAAGL